MSVTVNAVRCQECRAVLFSRAHHDFHRCPCGKTFVDGGFEYLRMGWSTETKPETLTLEVGATKKELYDDWNTGADKFGVVPPEDESSS